MIKGLGCSNSAHSKGSARSGHSCNVINDVHPSERDGGKFASEGHKKVNWNAASVSVNFRIPEVLRPHFIPNEIKNNTTFPVVHDLLEKD